MDIIFGCFFDWALKLSFGYHGVIMMEADFEGSNVRIIFHQCCVTQYRLLHQDYSTSAFDVDNSRRFHLFPNPFLHPFEFELWDASELGTDFQCLLNLKDVVLLILRAQHLFEEV